MPGLAKVGKTTRNPATRLAELSNATGVPTPFILAYQQPVTNCDFVESSLHRELENEGFRVASNREFFNAPLHVIIQKIVKISNSQIQDNLNNRKKTNKKSEQDHNLAHEIYELGNLYYYGTNETLKNDTKALKYYEQAASMEYQLAYSSVAKLYEFGSNGGIREDREKALFFYKKCVRSGFWWYKSSIARIFLRNGQKSAAISHWKNLFQLANENLETRVMQSNIMEDHLKFSLQLGQCAFEYFTLVSNKEIPNRISDFSLSKLRPYMVQFANTQLEYTKKWNENLQNPEKRFELTIEYGNYDPYRPDDLFAFLEFAIGK